MTENIYKFSKTQEENWKDLWHQPCHAKGWTSSIQASVTKVVQSNINGRDSEQNLCSLKFLKTALPENIYFDDTLQFGAQVYSDATSDKDSRCKSCRGQGMEKARDNPSVELVERQEHKGGYPGSTKRQQESPLCIVDGHVSPQKCGVRTQIAKMQRSESCSEEDIVKDDSGAYAVFTEQSSSASQMTAQK